MKKKTIMKPIPIIDRVTILITRFSGIRLRRTRSWDIEDCSFACSLKFVDRAYCINKHG
jgi:hypothetical protein